jgi:hypothetical protein
MHETDEMIGFKTLLKGVHTEELEDTLKFNTFRILWKRTGDTPDDFRPPNIPVRHYPDPVNMPVMEPRSAAIRRQSSIHEMAAGEYRYSQGNFSQRA